MTLQRDAERTESRYLHTFADFTNRRVLEVGCGEGRLTWQYTRNTRTTAGIDPNLDALRVAEVNRPVDLAHKTCFVCADAAHLPLQGETFDIAVLAWSL